MRTKIHKNRWHGLALSGAMALLGSAAVMAQPGDVTVVDMRVVQHDANTLELQLRPNAPWTNADGVLSLNATIRWETSAGGTLGAPDQTVGFADPDFPAPFCMAFGAALSENPGASGEYDNFDVGGFRYKSYVCLGAAAFGAGCSWPANGWVPYARLPITSPPTGCANFEVLVSDAYSQQENISFYMSLGGTEITANSSVVPPGVQIGNCTADCEGTVGGSALPGTACDDGDAGTGNDTWDANCICVGQVIDCEGTPGGAALPGTACDDGDAGTGNDTWDANCNCVGQLIDCEGTPGGTALPGTACDDGDAGTGNDTWDANCNCVGQTIDCEGTPGGAALPGTACDDGDAGTGLDTWDANCNCVGQLIDCEGTPGGPQLPGQDCDDGDPNTVGETYDANCNCTGGQVLDCEGTPGGTALPGTACDDGDAGTGNDTWDANCNCVGQLIDCEGTPGGSALPGTACDDGDPNTVGETYDANCNCTGGQVNDCEGTPGGTALPGTPCDDGDAGTGNDTWDANCNCVGQLIDCEGTPGGSALPGTACDDGDPNTVGETYDANCNCTGGQVNDCEGTPGGTALPGTPCDDGDAGTGNDTWDANCNCVGQLIDCEGTPGGSALPGTACDDGDPNTTGETYDANCNCTGGQLVDCEGTPGGTALPGTACDDGDAGTGNDTWDANCNCVGQLIDCEGTPGGTALPGTSCDDGDINTVNDTWNANCVCAGVPAGSEQITLEITLDDFGSETTWAVYDETGTNVILSGGPYADGQAGTVIVENLLLVQTCYELVVSDAGNNGIQNGGYTLYDSQSRRIITADGAFSGTSQIANGGDFCLPLSSQGLISSWCDKTDLVYANSTQIYASAQPGATGYQFWMFDPHGTYTRRVFTTTQNLRPTTLVTNPVPADLDLNVRVRALVGGNYTPFGKACVIRLNSAIVVAQNRDLLFNEGTGISMSLFPNPNRGEVVFLRLDGLEESEARIDLDVYDMFGKRVHAEQLVNSGTTFNHAMNFDVELAPGMYLVNVRIGSELYTQRLVRQ